MPDWFTEAQVEAARDKVRKDSGCKGPQPPLDTCEPNGICTCRLNARAALSAIPDPRAANYQPRVDAWMQACFGPEIAADTMERNHRFLEEAVELVQANGCTSGEAHQLVDYVFGRPVGERNQEVGGVMVCLAALCTASGMDMNGAAETELARVWTKVEAIRAKQKAKPKHSPLPASAPDPRAAARSEGFEAAKQMAEDAVWKIAESQGNDSTAISCARAIAALKPEPKP